MIDGKYHFISEWKGKPIIIDIAEVGGKYEVMALVEGGEEIDSYTTDDMAVAKRVFNDMCKRYSLPPLKGKYAKLRDDISKAITKAKAAITLNPEDGGTCNFDAPTVCLKGWNREKVKQAALEAGTDAYPWGMWGRIEFVFSVNAGHGNARTRYAEAMRDSLKEAGYDAGMYYAMD